MAGFVAMLRRPAFWGGAGVTLAVVALLGVLGLDWKRAHDAQEARGNRVVVQLVDVSGEPVGGAQVFAAPTSGKRIVAQEFEPGRHALNGLETGSVEIVAEVAGNRYHVMHPTQKSSATIVLPAGGRVAVTWALPSERDYTNGRIMLVFEPRQAETDRFEIDVPPAPNNRGSLVVPYVPAGTYLASLERWEDPPDANSKAVVIPLTAPLDVKVEEHELTRITLGLRNS